MSAASPPGRPSRADALPDPHRVLPRAPRPPLDAGPASPRLPRALRAQDDHDRARRAHRRGARTRPQGHPAVPGAHLPQPEDLRILDVAALIRYACPTDVLHAYEDEVIPYWRGRSLRDRIFEIAAARVARRLRGRGLHRVHGAARARPHGGRRQDLRAAAWRTSRPTSTHAVAAVDRSATRWPRAAGRAAGDANRGGRRGPFAERHAELAAHQAAEEPDAARRAELERIADVCRRVPAHAPRDFHEALQMYWFCHLAVITELNGWDAYSPGPPRPAPGAVLPAWDRPTAR